MAGIVYLVGAGPGDPDLITVKGLRYLRQADVVAYDRLVHPDLLREARPQAERIDVGKAPGRHRYRQDEINRLLVDRARAGKTVVRLKGGDPFVFGRGGEECQALAAAGVPFAVVPGITSAVAAPAAAGIPVTQRELAQSFTVVTGHTARGGAGGADDLDWAALARMDTLVFLMGVAALPVITRRLIAHGRSPATPVAVISCATTGHEQLVLGTLADIIAEAAGVATPATIVIGPVAALAREIGPAALAAPAPATPALRARTPQQPVLTFAAPAGMEAGA